MMAQVLFSPWRCSISILILVPDQREDSRVAASDFGLVHEKNAFEDTGMVAAPKLQRMMLSTKIATAAEGKMPSSCINFAWLAQGEGIPNLRMRFMHNNTERSKKCHDGGSTS